MKSHSGCSHIIFHKNMIWSDHHSLEHIFLGIWLFSPHAWNKFSGVCVFATYYVFRTKISFFSREWLRQMLLHMGYFTACTFFRCFYLEMSLIPFLFLTVFFKCTKILLILSNTNSLKFNLPLTQNLSISIILPLIP